jgi:hypothetical protein
MIKDKLSPIFARTKNTYNQKSLITSLRKVLAFLFVYENFTCYLYKSTLTKRNENDFTPRIKEFNFQIISTKQQLNDLVKDGFDLFSHSAKAEHRLEKGAVAGLVFVGKELASMEWVAVNAQAKASIDNYPCRVDYLIKEAYAGGVWTNPKYRGNGLHIYVYYKIYDFLRENGIVTVRSIVEVNNSAALKSHDRFAPEEKIEAKARYLRIMGLQFWRETPLKPTNNYERP